MDIVLIMSLIVGILACMLSVWFWTDLEKQSKFKQEENHKKYLKTLSEYNSTKLKHPTKPTKPTYSTTSNRSDRVDINNKVDDYVYTSSNYDSDSSYTHHSTRSSCGGSTSSDCGSSSCD